MIEEEMLEAWLKMSAEIKENRLLKELTFNEMAILHIVNEAKEITFKALCEKTKMLKSLLNRTVTSLVENGMLNIEDSKIDKRSKVLTINRGNIAPYIAEHKRVIALLASVKEKIGEEAARKLIELLNKVSEAVANNKI